MCIEYACSKVDSYDYCGAEIKDQTVVWNLFTNVYIMIGYIYSEKL